MAPITESVEINRPAGEVFAYLDQLDRHGEWQDGIVSAKVLTDGPNHVGTQVAETRRFGSREQSIIWELTAYDPPRSFSFHGIDGPVRVVGKGLVEPVGDASSRVTIELDFEGHGLGKMMAPMAKSQARKQIPKDHERLKEKLESGAS